MPGRKPKQGIDFAGWNTDIFENDTKIDALIDDQGWIGFCIYFYLCQKAYASDGYFYRWSYANAPTTARRMGGGISSGAVVSAVGTCLREGLFDKRLLDEQCILTSRGIQRRFMAATQKRGHRAVNQRFWLLDEAETAAGKITFLDDDLPDVGDSCAQNAHFLPGNAHFLPGNDTKSKVKESKVNTVLDTGVSNTVSAEQKNRSAPPVIELPLVDGTNYPITADQITEWMGLYPAVDVMQQLRNMRGWLEGTPEKRKTRKGVLRFVHRWLSRAQDQGGGVKTAPKSASGRRNVFADMLREGENIE